MANMLGNCSRTGPLRAALIGAATCALTALAPLFGEAAAQLIPVRTVPVADADQFEFFPAANLGMGGVSIAIRDSLLDPFRNPAKGVRVGRALYFGAPTFFSVSNHAGSGQTLPVGALLKSGSTFFGAALAVQEIMPARPNQSFFGFRSDVPTTSSFLPPSLEAQPNQPENNQYAYVTLGHRHSKANLAVGASAMWSDLHAMEGVELLFNGSHNVRQYGERLDLRLGAVKEWSGDRSLEAVVLRDQFDMSYDVGYAQLYWDPETRQNRIQTFNELSTDGHRTFGLHLAYEMPLPDSGWRMGALATANRISHERAPYYQVMQVPRDAGRSMAYNLGVGVSRTVGPSRFAVDAIVEPIWRRSRGRADTLTLGPAGLFAAGSVTNDSYFKFTNFVLRGGASRDVVLSVSESLMRLQFGVQVRSVNYTMEEHDLLRSAFRSNKHSWREWTHAWGTSFVFPGFEFGYQLQLASGMGRIGVPPDSGDDFVVSEFGSFPPIGSPTSPSVTLYPVRVSTHQLTFSVPIR